MAGPFKQAQLIGYVIIAASAAGWWYFSKKYPVKAEAETETAEINETDETN